MSPEAFIMNTRLAGSLSSAATCLAWLADNALIAGDRGRCVELIELLYTIHALNMVVSPGVL